MRTHFRALAARFTVGVPPPEAIRRARTRPSMYVPAGLGGRYRTGTFSAARQRLQAPCADHTCIVLRGRADRLGAPVFTANGYPAAVAGIKA